ncbi:hypothetical protein COU79_03735 [Candidatus Peregrinibacteria bacterium CG10_big_fil_rev_8_21_14_0_10_54_7]|nr:MAG: hypothetical protein COU79_03735 [Candidatus Peregrinibacteria bacterium CG10_big_fil_rev_8_21_14_0_10_54_7]
MLRKRKIPLIPTLIETISWTVCLLLLVIMLTSLTGLIVLHMEFDRVAIGSSNSSLAIIAAALSTTLWWKCMRHCLSFHCDK